MGIFEQQKYQEISSLKLVDIRVSKSMIVWSSIVLSAIFSMTTQAETKFGYRMSQPSHSFGSAQQRPQNSISGSTFSNSTYKDVTVPPHLTRPPVYQQSYPYSNRPHPHPSYPAYGHAGYPQQNGVTIIYNQFLPSQTTYSNQNYGYVNGQGSIESSSYMLISDWRRYNLPDPSVGMHWIYQNGRYLQIPNDR